MSSSHPATGRRRRILVPGAAESVPLASATAAADPPIYRALIGQWADRGRTLPGRHDPEWVRLAASPVAGGRIAAPRPPMSDSR